VPERGKAVLKTTFMGSRPALEAAGLGKSYERGNPPALNGLDLRVEAGTITALVGPNGAGKSTLIKTWVGFERPSAGSVAVCGVDPWRHRSAALALIGYVPQSPALYRELTVAEHLDLARALRSSFDRGVAQVHLNELSIPLDRRAGALSGGQQAQLGLALALGTRAPVLLLDEPLASLDPLARREFLHLVVATVRANGTTALLASHIVTDIEQACDHLVVLAGGETLYESSLEHALSTHRVVRDGHASTGDPVGSFVSSNGDSVSLVRVDPHSATDLPSATLDDVVLGYLASTRRPQTEESRA
jgi:ABC-2 type transport system ATP-binding protein